MKAVLSNRIYLECSIEERIRLDKLLTYTIPSLDPNSPPIIIKNLSRFNDSIVTLPIGRVDLIPEGHEIIDKRTLAPITFPDFKFELRASQQEVYNDISDNCIINAWVSWGKTFTAIAIATKLGQKTLVLVDTVNLFKQWAEEIEKCLGIKPGLIGDGKYEIDSPIVIGINRSVYNNIDKLKKSFGTIIFDECHHISAMMLTKISDSFYSRYKIGLSGTVKRKDGKHVIFPDYLGQKLYQPPKENYMVPKVVIVHSKIHFPDGNEPWPKKINKLLYSQEYIELVSAISCIQASAGHKVLCLADRTEFLMACAKLSGDKADYIIGKKEKGLTREQKLAKLKSGETQILYGTQRIFAEGFSESSLSCLVLGTPNNNIPLLEQVIGRVIREVAGKKQPVVVDINLQGSTARRQAMNRLGYYIEQGYEMEHIQL